MFSNLKEDLKVNYSLVSKLVCINYRFGNKIYSLKTPIVKQLLIMIYKITEFIVRIISQCEIPPTCTVGKGLRLEHGGKGTVIHSKVTIGENARIFHQVTIGISGAGEEIPPKIGNNVLIGTGAKIIGDIFVGDNARIGANAVVTKNVPENSTAVGIPARNVI